MDAYAGNVTDVCKIGQELLMSVRNFSQCIGEERDSGVEIEEENGMYTGVNAIANAAANPSE